jgi:hypothetical protein
LESREIWKVNNAVIADLNRKLCGSNGEPHMEAFGAILTAESHHINLTTRYAACVPISSYSAVVFEFKVIRLEHVTSETFTENKFHAEF